MKGSPMINNNKPAHYPLLLNHPDAQRLWRATDSSAECSAEGDAAVRKRRHLPTALRKRARALLVVGALSLGLGLLVLWILLLLEPTSMEMSISPNPRRADDMPEPGGTRKMTTMAKSTIGTRKMKMNHHAHIIQVTIPSTTTMRTTTSSSSSSTNYVKSQKPITTATKPASLRPIFAKMELENGRQIGGGGGHLVARINQIKGTGSAASSTAGTLRTTTATTTETPTTTTPISTTTTSSSTTMTTTLTTNTKNSSTTTTTTLGQTTSTEDDEEDGDDLFWMRDPMVRPSRPPTSPMTTTTPPKSEDIGTTVKSDGYEVKRPTIEFGPINAKEMAAGEGDEKKEERVRQELEAIIASVERERWDPERDPDVRPVEIPFDPAGSPNIPEPEPVWRRPPPQSNEVEADKVPPPPPAPEMKLAMPEVHPPALDKIHLSRKRREAPVIVTALLDIGRGEWQRFTRHFDQYLGYLANILFRLQNNMIIYCDSSVSAYLRGLGDRIGWDRLQVVEMNLTELPYHKYRDEIDQIMRWEQEHWRKDWDAQMRAHPETMYPDYDILVNSKPYFLYNATQISRFKRSSKESQEESPQFFVWVDAGYGHGSTSAIPYGVWSPTLRPGKITLVQLTSKLERVERYTLDKVYRKQRSVVSGGFLAGSPDAIRRFWTFFNKTFMEMLDRSMVDDDQTTLLLTIQNFRATFHILFGGWFDAFKLLPSHN